MSGPWINAGREPEHEGDAREEHLPQGSLFLGDAKYFTLASMRARSKAGGYWLVPAKADLHFYDPQGIKWDLVSYLSKHTDEKVVDVQIQAGLRDRLSCRLIAVHLPTEQRRVKPYYEVYRKAWSKGVQTCGPKGDKSAIKRGKSQKKTKKTSKSRLQVGEWAIFLTNVQIEQMTAQEALVIMRCRGPIELLWKLWKQYGKIDAWRSAKPARIETEIYAKVLGLLIQRDHDHLGMLAGPATELTQSSTGHAIGGWCLRLCPHWRDVPRTRDYDHHGGYE